MARPARLRIGTRGSALALAQAGQVVRALREHGLEPELVTITTSGDRGARMDKSRFVKEIEDALLAGDVDLAVHSAKDLPGELPPGLEIVGAPGAEDARDALVGAPSLDELAPGARLGTSSLRRRSQLLALRPDLEVVELRGNVDTRLGKLASGNYDAIVVALAGLARLGRDREAAAVLTVDEVVPAPGQGILALEARTDDERARAAAGAVNDVEATQRLAAERAVVAALDATCHTPVGASARIDSEEMVVVAYTGLSDGSEWIRDELTGDRADPAGVGTSIAKRLLAAGAGELLRRAEAETLGETNHLGSAQ